MAEQLDIELAILEKNVYDLQEQLANAHRRIAELTADSTESRLDKLEVEVNNLKTGNTNWPSDYQIRYYWDGFEYNTQSQPNIRWGDNT
jgi:hypothetical protein